ncbi:MAG: response regulator [Bdellovibrionaceae bacterium]|nr:response regulator [Pseudobdellovibrionaceae bacterium]
MKFLVVDDSKVLIKKISLFLEKLGHQVLGHAYDGFQGAELYQVLKPEVVLLDVTMPNRDGRECLVDIMKVNPHAVVIMLSATKSDDVKKDCKNLGARAFLHKDDLIDPETFGSALDQALQQVENKAA